MYIYIYIYVWFETYAALVFIYFLFRVGQGFVCDASSFTLGSLGLGLVSFRGWLKFYLGMGVKG